MPQEVLQNMDMGLLKFPENVLLIRDEYLSVHSRRWYPGQKTAGVVRSSPGNLVSVCGRLWLRLSLCAQQDASRKNLFSILYAIPPFE
jgi:hypothetical protein